MKQAEPWMLSARALVQGYRAGDLEKAYPALAVEEDWFVNYGFVSCRHNACSIRATAPTRCSSTSMRRA